MKLIPGNPESAALATAVGAGQVWIVYPFRYDEQGHQGTTELFYDLGPKARDVVAIFSDITKDGRFAYCKPLPPAVDISRFNSELTRTVTITTGNHIAALDISDLDNPKRLDDPDEVQPTEGPHYIKITPDQKHLVVTDYFLQTGDIGIVNTPADYKALYIDLLDDGSLHFNRSIDFQKEFANRGGAKPHSSVIFDFTDPDHPVYD